MQKSDPLVELEKKYRASLPQKRKAIDEAWQRFAHRRDAEQESKSLSILVHRLAGSGASYGYMEISECAIRFEDLLDGWVEKRSSHPSLDVLEQALDELLQAIARAHRSGPEDVQR